MLRAADAKGRPPALARGRERGRDELNYPKARRAEFDWLRVLALGMLMIFHSIMGYSSWPWHVNDPHDSALLDGILDFMLRWRVSLVFIVSGSALMLALDRRAPFAILRERSSRLLVPLVFGMAVIVPPQIYLDRVQHGKFHGSFLEYLPHAYSGIYPVGNLTWNHLWFIPYVLMLTAAGMPLFLWARAPERRYRMERWMRAIADGHLYWLLVIPLAIAQLLMLGQGNDDHTFIGDSHGWIEFGTLFVLGGAMARWPTILASIQRERYAALVVGIVAYSALKKEWPEDPTSMAGVFGWCNISAINVLAWVLAFAGFLTKWFNRGSPALTYLTEAAMPVYVLHQTLIVFVVYDMHRYNLPVGLKILFTFCFTIAAALVLYEGAIRRSKWLRILFGVKPRAHAIGPELLVPNNGEVTNRSSERSS
jgi:glucan biosynthesis protein C